MEIRDLRNRLVEIDYERAKRIKVEDALRESMENFQALADNAYDCIVITASEGGFVYANKRMSEVTGYTEKELLKMGIRDVSHPDEVRKAMRDFKKRLGGDNLFGLFETTMVRKDGGFVPIEVTASNTIWHGQQAVIAIIRDITERKSAEEALKDSEEKFRTLAEESPNMIFINNLKNIVYANKVAVRIMGYSRDELYSPKFDFMDMIAPDSRELVQNAFKMHIQGSDIPPYEYTIMTKDGTLIESIITTKLIKYEGRSAILGIVTDITDRKRGEEQLKMSESQLRTTINSLPDAIHVIDEKLNVVMINDSFIRWNKLLGLDLDPIGKNLFEVFPFLSARIEDEYQKVFETGEPLATSEETLIEDALYITQTIKIPVVEKGWVRQIITVIRDVTQSKKYEQELKESEEKFRILSEQNIMGILILQDDRIVYANNAIGEISELSVQDILDLGQAQFLQFIQPEDKEFVKEQARKKQSGEDKDVVTSYNCRIKTRSGTEKLIELYSKTINYKGRPADFVLLNDLSRQKGNNSGSNKKINDRV